MPGARAVRIRGQGGVEVLAIDDLEVREPGPGEVLVQVAACGLNRADILQRRGLYPAPPGVVPDVPGLEYAGTVAAVGQGVTLAPGTPVMGIVGGGAMATYVVVHERELMLVPRGMSLEHAAALPEVFLTAYDALFVEAEVELGSHVLIHAVASGVGTAAIQLANVAGAFTIGTSRTRAKLERCVKLGLEHPVLIENNAFARRVHELTAGQGAQVILDTVGAAYLEENLRAVARRGRIVVIGLMGGVTGSVPLALLLNQRATIAGSVLRSRPLEEKASLAQRFARNIVPLFASGVLSPVVDDILPMSDVARAHERMEQNQTFGKLVLCW